MKQEATSQEQAAIDYDGPAAAVTYFPMIPSKLPFVKNATSRGFPLPAACATVERTVFTISLSRSAALLAAQWASIPCVSSC